MRRVIPLILSLCLLLALVVPENPPTGDTALFWALMAALTLGVGVVLTVVRKKV